MSIKVTWEMAEEKLKSQLSAAMGRGMTEIAMMLEADAILNCPVDTGRLRASITHKVENDGISASATIGTNVEYAPHVEFGTVHQKAQPFLRPALIENESRARDRFRQQVERVIR